MDHRGMHHPAAVRDRRLRVVAGLALLLVFLFLAIALQPKPPDLAQASKPAQDTSSANPLNLSPADAARRAAIAKLGFIDPRAHDLLNGFDSYSPAMALYNQLTDVEKHALGNWRTKLDPQAAAALSAKLQPILQLMRDARGYLDLNPYSAAGRDARLNTMESLSQVAQWEANYQFQTDPAGALQNLAAAEALDRVAAGTLGGFATYFSLRADTVQIIAQNANALPAGQIPDLNFITDPAGVTQASQDILNAQAAQLKYVVDQYANPATRSYASQIINDNLIPYLGLSTNAAGAVPLLQWIAQTDQQFANALPEPEAQFQQWYSEMNASTSSVPSASFAPPIIQNQRAEFETFEVQNAMLAAGIALQQGNQSQFQAILDPGNGQPFTIAQTPNGFQLTSSFNYNGQPVTLNFGPPPQ